MVAWDFFDKYFFCGEFVGDLSLICRWFPQNYIVILLSTRKLLDCLGMHNKLTMQVCDSFACTSKDQTIDDENSLKCQDCESLIHTRCSGTSKWTLVCVANNIQSAMSEPCQLRRASKRISYYDFTKSEILHSVQSTTQSKFSRHSSEITNTIKLAINDGIRGLQAQV